MNLPLDVFEMKLADVGYIERNEPESKSEKAARFDEAARERLSANVACAWWSDK